MYIKAVLDKIDAVVETANAQDVRQDLHDLQRLANGMKRGAGYALRAGELTRAADMLVEASEIECKLAILRHKRFLLGLANDPAITALRCIDKREQPLCAIENSKADLQAAFDACDTIKS